ncbi:histidine phosphatase family protein [Streptomyces sp. NPDC007369]|uniref:SixA phosphatase family protein n=1 Tax=Streptomyces sp. NPDC007369 TaxID=3154589 RepID=UPI0033D3C05A
MPDTERRIVVVRHAKAVPKETADVEDFARELADRGRADAPGMGRRLAESGFAVDLALCSPARRTRQTWQLMLPALADPPTTVFDDRLYQADAEELLGVLGEQPDGLTGLLVVGHNPAVHELAVGLCGDGPEPLVARLDEKFPTCAVAVLTLNGGWGSLAWKAARLAALWTPRD